ncbi:MAG: GNAT family N-acetyltransferase [Cyanobacteria bacterium P01_H01_bin.121]
MFVNPQLVLRAAQPEDIEIITHLIRQLAIYERLEHEVVGNAADLAEHLFGDRPYVEAILAEVASQVVGFALFFPNYSTFLMQPGLYLEDLFVLPDYRRQGIGKAMLRHLAQLAVQRGYGRFEWSVLDWNQPAIDFYQRLGATVMPDWRTCRVTDVALKKLSEMV